MWTDHVQSRYTRAPMSTHVLRASQVIPRPIDEVFRFFAEPRNLARITPASMGFEFRSDDFRIRDGLDIDYRLRPLLGIPIDLAHADRQLRPPQPLHRRAAQGAVSAVGARPHVPGSRGRDPHLRHHPVPIAARSAGRPCPWAGRPQRAGAHLPTPGNDHRRSLRRADDQPRRADHRRGRRVRVRGRRDRCRTPSTRSPGRRAVPSR